MVFTLTDKQFSVASLLIMAAVAMIAGSSLFF